MIVGKIFGKVNTTEFKFKVEKETKKFEYVQVYHPAYKYVLCQIVEIEKQEDTTTAYCTIIGYKDKGKIKKPRIPFDPGSEVLIAKNDFIRDIIDLGKDESQALIGKLDGKDIKVNIDLNKVLTKHMAVLAKSGSGKSYSVGVLLEEMIEREIPVLVIDPHGEYSSLKHKNTDEKDVTKLTTYDLQPKGFTIDEFGDPELKKGVKPLKISNNLTAEEIVHMLPGKLSNTQLSILYSSLKSLDVPGFDNLQLALEMEESNSKWSIIKMVEYLRKQDIFSDSPPKYEEMIQSGKATILNLRGIDPEIQEIIVYKIAKDLFDLRKKNKISPFFLVVEEAHNYCPERSFGESKSSKVFRTIASEGRKFGLGLCVVSQRPARVDKNVLSQCSTQFILKVTNPNDLKAITSSVEGITSSTSKEIQNLLIGTSMITGISDVPLFVNVRPRKSLHGGTAQDLVGEDAPEDNFVDLQKDFDKTNRYPVIKPFTSLEDYLIMNDLKPKEVNKMLIPCKLIMCTKNEEKFKLLFDMNKGGLIVDKENYKIKKIPDIKSLDNEEISLLKSVFGNKHVDTNHESFDSLKRKGFVEMHNGNVSLNSDFAFRKLHHFKIFDDINFEEVSYDEKLEERAIWKNIKEKIGTLTTIKDVKDCYLVRFEKK